MTTLVLIRHGESEANRKGFFAGQTDVDLLENGLMQAKKTAEYIKKNYEISCVVASDLKRAYYTGKCIADATGAELMVHQGLREINAGDWSRMQFDKLEVAYAQEYGIWKQDIGKAKCPNGESVKQLADRIMETLTQIARCNDGKTLVVATHATPIRSALTMILHGDLEKMKDVPWVSNASVTEIVYEEGQWRCGIVSEDAHLKELKTVFPANV